MSPIRTLAYKFLMLSHICQLEIAIKLDLLTSAELQETDSIKQAQTIFTNARDKGLLPELWDAVRDTGAYRDSTMDINPFRE
jgi:hypothetical protein